MGHWAVQPMQLVQCVVHNCEVCAAVQGTTVQKTYHPA